MKYFFPDEYHSIKKCLLQCNKQILLIFLSILFPNIHSGLNFIQVDAEKTIIICAYIHNMYCFLKKFFYCFTFICIHIILIIIVYFNLLTLA